MHYSFIVRRVLVNRGKSNSRQPDPASLAAGKVRALSIIDADAVLHDRVADRLPVSP
jgi:hypothetical protein